MLISCLEFLFLGLLGIYIIKILLYLGIVLKSRFFILFVYELFFFKLKEKKVLYCYNLLYKKLDL